MAQISEGLQRFIDRAAAEAARNDKIHKAAFDEGIIATLTQETVSTEDAIMHLFALFVKELKRQDTLKSTGGGGKFADVANRVLMALSHGWRMRVNDFSCRMQGRPDITVTLVNGKRLQVEIKTGQGELAKGLNFGDTIEALKAFGMSESYIVWYYDMRGFDKTRYDLHQLDDLPYIFMRKCDLIAALEEYNGELDTWLKMNGEKAVNLQAVVTSNKKLRFLEDIAFNKSYDWIECRDRGNLVEK